MTAGLDIDRGRGVVTALNLAPEMLYTHLKGPTPEDAPIRAMVDHVVAVLARGRRAGELLSSAYAISITQHARMLASLRGHRAPTLDDLRLHRRRSRPGSAARHQHDLVRRGLLGVAGHPDEVTARVERDEPVLAGRQEGVLAIPDATEAGPDAQLHSGLGAETQLIGTGGGDLDGDRSMAPPLEVTDPTDHVLVGAIQRAPLGPHACIPCLRGALALVGADHEVIRLAGNAGHIGIHLLIEVDAVHLAEATPDGRHLSLVAQAKVELVKLRGPVACDEERHKAGRGGIVDLQRVPCSECDARVADRRVRIRATASVDQWIIRTGDPLREEWKRFPGDDLGHHEVDHLVLQRRIIIKRVASDHAVGRAVETEGLSVPPVQPAVAKVRRYADIQLVRQEPGEVVEAARRAAAGRARLGMLVNEELPLLDLKLGCACQGGETATRCER